MYEKNRRLYNTGLFYARNISKGRFEHKHNASIRAVKNYWPHIFVFPAHYSFLPSGFIFKSRTTDSRFLMPLNMTLISG